MTDRKLHPKTLALHAGWRADPATGAVAPPIYQTTSYQFQSTEHAGNLFALRELGNIYTRIGNPTVDILEQRLAALEGGVAALAVASGQAASAFSIQNLARTGDNVVIGGFIIGDGDENARIVIRAIGPSLKAAGVANPLPDPVLELHDAGGAVINSNDDGTGDALQIVGLAPADPKESAILARLAPGAYTAIVRGKDNATGVALVEVFRVP